MLYSFTGESGSVEAFQLRLIWLHDAEVTVSPVGTVGGVVSTHAGVVTDAALLAPDTLPAVSTAVTVYE